MLYKPWSDSAKAFLDYMGRKPTPKHTVDRFPNPDGNYEPGNVRWATKSEQSSNRRLITFARIDGRVGSLKHLCKELGLNHFRVRYLMFGSEPGRSAQEAADLVRSEAQMPKLAVEAPA
jgi:hypothetical protein